MKMLTLFLVLFYSLSSQVWAGDKSLLDSLPPDPGEAGKATLAGIDSDNDGVRDDVQRWIALTYPNSQKTRAALTQQTKVMEQVLLDAADPLKSMNNALQLDRGTDCVVYIKPNSFYEILMEHRSAFLNTYVRSKAWLQADRHLSGHMFSESGDDKSGCNFNPDTMPN